MVAEKKVKYLKIDRGRYYYQRRVPDQFRELLGISKWQMPCGDVSYAKAVQLVVNWAEEHDDLLTKLKSPEGYDAIEADVLRTEDTRNRIVMDSLSGTGFDLDDEDLVAFDGITKPWQAALQEVSELDEYHTKPKAPEHEVLQLKAKIAYAKRDGLKLGKIRLTPYPEFVELAQAHMLDNEIVDFEFTPHPARPMSNERYLDLLTDIYNQFFGEGSIPPSDPDDRDEYTFAKKRIERDLPPETSLTLM